MLMIGTTSVQGGGHVKADLPIWLWILLGLEPGGWLQRFMVRMAA